MQHGKEIRVREAVGADAAGIASVQVTAWKVAYIGMLPAAALAAANVRERTERWTEILAASPRKTLVASVSGELIGWCGFGESRDEDRSSDVGEVYGLYVHPESWRIGAGRKLWTASCERLKRDGFGVADVWVLEANDRARRFYESMGCVVDADASKGFEQYGELVPEVRYSLTLSEFK